MLAAIKVALHLSITPLCSSHSKNLNLHYWFGNDNKLSWVVPTTFCVAAAALQIGREITMASCASCLTCWFHSSKKLWLKVRPRVQPRLQKELSAEGVSIWSAFFQIPFCTEKFYKIGKVYVHIISFITTPDDCYVTKCNNYTVILYYVPANKVLLLWSMKTQMLNFALRLLLWGILPSLSSLQVHDLANVIKVSNGGLAHASTQLSTLVPNNSPRSSRCVRAMTRHFANP